jgi:ribosomal-protein-serine acetyltransferase
VCEKQIGGVIGFHRIDWSNRTTSLGYWLGEAWQGEGRMTGAVRLLTEHALEAWELNRVEIRAAVDNRRSRAIPERLGFLEEATMREVERVGERHLDCVVYSAVSS